MSQRSETTKGQRFVVLSLSLFCFLSISHSTSYWRLFLNNVLLNIIGGILNGKGSFEQEGVMIRGFLRGITEFISINEIYVNSES